MHWLSRDHWKLIDILEEFCIFGIISFLRVLAFFLQPEMKCFAFFGCGETPYVFSLRQGESTQGKKRRRKLHKRVQTLLCQDSSSAKPKPYLWCPQGSSSFQRKHREIKEAGQKLHTFGGLAVKHPGPISAFPLPSLLPSYSDTYLYLYLLIPVLLYRDVLHPAWIFPEEEEAAAALGRCEYCLSHPLLSPLKAHTQAQSDILAH